jgi:transposase
VGEAIEEVEAMVVEVGTGLKRLACPHCDSANTYRHGRAKKRGALHAWSQGKTIYLEIARHRWRCCHCWYSFTKGAELVRRHSRGSAANSVGDDPGVLTHNDYAGLLQAIVVRRFPTLPQMRLA